MRLVICFLCTIFSSYGETDLSWENVIANRGQGPLFVSLGSDCLAAGMIRHFGKRQAAFPLDWILSLDNEQVCQILHNDFKDFTNELYLIQHPINGEKLVHSQYHLEFTHDLEKCNWRCPKARESFHKKYQKRIERFRKLNEYEGSVVFIRTIGSSYEQIRTNPETYWFAEPSNVDELEYGRRLYDILSKTFPRLDFKLLLVLSNRSKNRIEMDGQLVLCCLKNIEEHRNWEALFQTLFNTSETMAKLQ